MDRNSNSDIEVEPYEEIVRSVSYSNPMDARSLNSSAGLTFQTTVCEPILVTVEINWGMLILPCCRRPFRGPPWDTS